MYKIAVCDDEAKIRKTLVKMLENHPRAEEFSVTVSECCDDLYDMLVNGRSFDLIILDIMSDGMNGIEFGRRLRNEWKNSLTQMIYISSEQGYAMELFEFRPLNFLVKPIAQKKLLECVDQAMELAAGMEGNLSFSMNRTEHMIPLRQIRYIESNDKLLIVHDVQEENIFYGKLNALEVPADFVRIHKSYLVNSNYVRQLRFDSLMLDCGTELPISRAYRKQVRDCFAAMVMGR